MTRRVLNEIHVRLAGERFWLAFRAGEEGNIATRAFDETVEAARAEYRALPFWRRLKG
jgi:hypothetical protein